MAHEVIWTAAALDQLAELFDYLAEPIASVDALNYCDAFSRRLQSLVRSCT